MNEVDHKNNKNINLIRRKLGQFKNFLIRPTLPLFHANSSNFEDYGRQINISSKKIYRHYIFCCYLYGIRPHQYCIFNFYKIDRNEKKKFVCDVKTNKICNLVNIYHSFEENCFDNKALFYEKFKEFIDRDYILTQKGIRDVSEFIKNHSEIMIKPLNDHGGKGIRKIITADYRLDDLAKMLCGESLVIEEVVSQCEEMASLNNSTINTIRVVAVRDSNGEVFIVGCSVRIGRQEKDVDNVSSGGIIFPLDKETGQVCGKGIDKDCRLYDSHPDSGMYIIGFSVPRYKEMMKFIYQFMDVIPEQRLVGWDVCIGKDKCILIEGNLHPGCVTFETDGIGKKELLELALTN